MGFERKPGVSFLFFFFSFFGMCVITVKLQLFWVLPLVKSYICVTRNAASRNLLTSFKISSTKALEIFAVFCFVFLS